MISDKTKLELIAKIQKMTEQEKEFTGPYSMRGNDIYVRDQFGNERRSTGLDSFVFSIADRRAIVSGLNVRHWNVLLQSLEKGRDAVLI